VVPHDRRSGKLKTGEWLLVRHPSGVGVRRLQTAKALGAKVTAPGVAGKLDKLKGMGLDLGIRTRAGRLRESRAGRRTGGKAANLVINNVGGSVFPETIRALAYEGRHATIGYVDACCTRISTSRRCTPSASRSSVSPTACAREQAR